ncbi:MAG: hypothetical protein HPY81_03085 [Firmicutes bacterium]|nr:hypothetical protein [Bacillota bacterium]
MQNCTLAQNNLACAEVSPQARATVWINAKRLSYQELNATIHEAVFGGAKVVEVENVNGQRYIGRGLNQPVEIILHGTPGNDLGCFLNGPQIIVRGNGQDCIGNTMNDGKIVVHGDAGDVLGYGMRGGKLFIRGNVGYRVGIHMKEYRRQVPVMVIGGTAGDFFGEYMAGGIIILLGLEQTDRPIAGDYLGTGMHGGVIYVRGEVDPAQLGKEVVVMSITPADEVVLDQHLSEFCRDFNLDYAAIRNKPFIKLVPTSHRPYGRLYAY